jgi:hypothetical protein
MCITKLGHYPIILGIPSPRLHDAAVHFASNTVTFGSRYCITHCHDTSVMVQGVTEEPPEQVYHAKEILAPQTRPLRPFRGNSVKLNRAAFCRMVSKGRFAVLKASLYEINKAIEAKDLNEQPLEEILPEQYHEFLPLFE